MHIKNKTLVCGALLLTLLGGLVLGDVVPIGHKTVANPCTEICNACFTVNTTYKLHYRKEAERELYNRPGRGCSNQSLTYILYW
jgi:hypothetical protein